MMVWWYITLWPQNTIGTNLKVSCPIHKLFTTKKVAFRDELGPRPWSMVTIRHVFLGLRGRSENFFFHFRGPLQPRIGPKRGRWSSGPWSMMISRFRLRSQRKCVLWRAWGPNVSVTGDLFFSRSRTCLSFPGRAVYDSRSWVPDVSLTKRENIEFLDSFSPLISGCSALTSIPAPLLNVEGGCRLMGPRCQPHKTRIFWFLPLFFTTDIWLLDFKYQSLPPC